MRVQFADPQPGTFIVGSTVGSFVFTNGVHDAVPEAIFHEWQTAGLALVAAPTDLASDGDDTLDESSRVSHTTADRTANNETPAEKPSPKAGSAKTAKKN